MMHWDRDLAEDLETYTNACDCCEPGDPNQSETGDPLNSNAKHVRILASIASQVVDSYRHEFDSRVREGLRAENRDRFEDRTKRIRSRAEHAGHLDPSWDYRLPERFQT